MKDFASDQTRNCIADLRDTLADFRSRKGFGRGIAAPQIGTTHQIIYTNSEYRGALVNPKITQRSRRTFTLWDDCFSFPDLLVKVVRHYSVTVSFKDEDGTDRTVRAAGAFSELLQHEIDHLHGILAVDRAVDSRHIILRSEFQRFAEKRTMTM